MLLPDWWTKRNRGQTKTRMGDDRLWPVRPRPLADELLSTWIVRLAKRNGQKVQAFCDCEFGNQRQLWNRDIDRLAPEWLLSDLSTHTAVPLERVKETTLANYEGRLFRKMHLSGQLRWILPLLLYHRKRLGNGMQFCPQCLASDKDPYFRRRWRVALYTFCPVHECMLYDCCQNCSSPIAFHRGELGRPTVLDSGLLCSCWDCGFDLRSTELVQVQVLDPGSFVLFRALVKGLEEAPAGSLFEIDSMDLLHQFCKLLVSACPHVRLLDFAVGRVGCSAQAISKGRSPFEERSVEERHFILQLAIWLMADLENRIRDAWECGAIRYNNLLKDLQSPPQKYATIVARFNRRIIDSRAKAASLS